MQMALSTPPLHFKASPTTKWALVDRPRFTAEARASSIDDRSESMPTTSASGRRSAISRANEPRPHPRSTALHPALAAKATMSLARSEHIGVLNTSDDDPAFMRDLRSAGSMSMPDTLWRSHNLSTRADRRPLGLFHPFGQHSEGASFSGEVAKGARYERDCYSTGLVRRWAYSRWFPMVGW